MDRLDANLALIVLQRRRDREPVETPCLRRLEQGGGIKRLAEKIATTPAGSLCERAGGHGEGVVVRHVANRCERQGILYEMEKVGGVKQPAAI